jgi:predicted ribosome quality control (RQC) complex YloA/Tae2 family protein
MQVELDIRKSVAENAADYYEKSKKAKRKLAGLKEAIKKTEKALAKVELAENAKPKKLEKKIVREREWYEKFHWFFSSDGFLAIGGKDVRTNIQVVKKHMKPHDVYFHADVQGASSVIVITEGKTVPYTTLEEAAEFAVSYSKVFQMGLAAASAYYVKPEQVKTAAKSGEYLPKGGFVITGERTWFKDVPVRVAVAFDGKRVIAGSERAIRSQTKNYVLIIPGKMKKGEVGKIVKARLEKMHAADIDLTECIQALPAGDADVE